MAARRDGQRSSQSNVAALTSRPLRQRRHGHCRAEYALAKVVDFISHSAYWKSTAIFILEDDAQSGGDHVDAHRSFGYAISPYSKRGVSISTNYNTVNVLRTIEDLLGIDHLNQSDANAAPMADVFTHEANLTPYTALIPGSLCG